MSYWKTATNAYVNSEQVVSLWVDGSASTWHVNAQTSTNDDIQLEGVWASQSDALDKAQELCQGFDPSTL